MLLFKIDRYGAVDSAIQQKKVELSHIKNPLNHNIYGQCCQLISSMIDENNVAPEDFFAKKKRLT